MLVVRETTVIPGTYGIWDTEKKEWVRNPASGEVYTRDTIGAARGLYLER